MVADVVSYDFLIPSFVHTPVCAGMVCGLYQNQQKNILSCFQATNTVIVIGGYRCRCRAADTVDGVLVPPPLLNAQQHYFQGAAT